MLTLPTLQDTFMLLVTLALLVLQIWAFVDALVRRSEAYVAAGKMTKPAWSIILGLAIAAHLLIASPISFLNLIGTVAALVYLVDARPAMRSLTRR